MGCLIDISVLIDAERGRVDLADSLASAGSEPVFLSAISASELLLGVHRSSSAHHRARRTAFVEHVLGQIALLPIDLATARIHAELAAAVMVAGTPVGPHDLWLAAAAVTRGLTLVTTNARELGRVPGLVVEDWSSQRPSARA